MTHACPFHRSERDLHVAYFIHDYDVFVMPWYWCQVVEVQIVLHEADKHQSGSNSGAYTVSKYVLVPGHRYYLHSSILIFSLHRHKTLRLCTIYTVEFVLVMMQILLKTFNISVKSDSSRWIARTFISQCNLADYYVHILSARSRWILQSWTWIPRLHLGDRFLVMSVMAVRHVRYL